MKKFRIVVAGCGGMANTWISYALGRKDCEIAALVDINEENAKNMAQKNNLNCKIFKDIYEAVNTVRPNLVFDVTIPESHRHIVTTALEAGCDVFGEKPLAATMQEARDMVAVSQRTGKSYFVMQNRRYDSRIRSLRDIVASDIIGKAGYIGADFFLGPHFGGFRDVMDSPLILDMAIHTFDAARFIMGRDAVSVYCCEFNPPGSWYRGNASAICIFELDDGSVFCYRGSWCSEGVPTSWESQWRVSGSKGTAIWDGVNSPYYELAVASDENRFMNEFLKVTPELSWKGREGHVGCLDEMFSALAAGKKAMTDCADNIKSLAMVFAAIESSSKGTKVQITF